MQRKTDRNLTVRLPLGLLRQLKKQSAAEGMSMNAYLERVLKRALQDAQDEPRILAAARLLARSNKGLYSMSRALSREEAHDRYA